MDMVKWKFPKWFYTFHWFQVLFLVSLVLNILGNERFTLFVHILCIPFVQKYSKIELCSSFNLIFHIFLCTPVIPFIQLYISQAIITSGCIYFRIYLERASIIRQNTQPLFNSTILKCSKFLLKKLWYAELSFLVQWNFCHNGFILNSESIQELVHSQISSTYLTSK